jgi:hypothetical protein
LRTLAGGARRANPLQILLFGINATFLDKSANTYYSSGYMLQSVSGYGSGRLSSAPACPAML